MKKILVLIFCISLLGQKAFADEGMWLLPFLQQTNIKDMKAKGLKISAKDIYDANANSLKDAIVIFGRGCTGEIVSADGLLFTNHHCGYGNIQQLSSVEHDYLKNGFWAMDRSEELPAPGLSVRFIRHIEDVTDRILEGISDSASEEERQAQIGAVVPGIMEQYNKDPRFEGMAISVQPFFGNNQYILFAIEEYRDVRLVGAPPTSIGKFGGDTDNWMWPRHTGDFSIFRVYSAPDGKPAEYSKDNVPYKAPVHLKVSTKGYKEGDFAMIMGFPGSTSRYMTSYEIDYTLNTDNPNRISIRGVRQDILKRAMDASDEIRIKYASKYAQSSNYWKNSIGMSRGLEKLGVKAQKQAQEEAFRAWAAASPDRTQYGLSLELIENAVNGRAHAKSVNQILQETLTRSVEIISASSFERMIQSMGEPTQEKRMALLDAAAEFYKDYDPELDRAVAKAMFRIAASTLRAEDLPSVFSDINEHFEGNVDNYVDFLYGRSVFANRGKFTEFVQLGDYSQISRDPAVMLRNSVMEAIRKNQIESAPFDLMFTEGHRLYIAGLMAMQPNKMHYSDANFTIRLTYGNILPYEPADAVTYNYFTTLKGVIEKDQPGSTEFDVPQKLKDLYYAKDFGRYGFNGDVNVGFISNNDITGGNSGSPVLNAKGELIGLAFDGNWEAMSGDIAFEPELQRCINVDIRYVLFVIDKFAGAGYLIDELTLAK